MSAKEENYICSYNEKCKEHKGKLYAIIYSYVMAKFWMLAALIFFDLKKNKALKELQKKLGNMMNSRNI